MLLLPVKEFKLSLSELDHQTVLLLDNGHAPTSLAALSGCWGRRTLLKNPLCLERLQLTVNRRAATATTTMGCTKGFCS